MILLLKLISPLIHTGDAIIKILILYLQLALCWLGSSVVCRMDTSKYTAGRGTHLNLKRAENSRVTVSKIPGACLLQRSFPNHAWINSHDFLLPAIVNNLMNKIFAWKDEKNMVYGGAGPTFSTI